QVLGRASPVGEMAGGFDNVIDLQVFPRQRRGVFFREAANILPVDLQRRLRRFDRAFVSAMHGVVTEQIGQVAGRNEGIHTDDWYALVLCGGAANQPADASESVDSQSHGHLGLPEARPARGRYCKSAIGASPRVPSASYD